MRKARLHLNLGYVTKLVMRGKWEKVEKHLSGFFSLAFTERDSATNELLSLIKRQRFLQLLYIGNTQACVEMLRKDLALVKGRDVYNKLNEALLHSQPLTLEIFKEYSLDESYRRHVAEQLMISIKRHPHLLPFTIKPQVEAGTLRKLINQRCG